MDKMEFVISWENQDFMEMEFKHGDDDSISIIKVGENGKLSEIIDEVKSICRKFFILKLDEVASEMLEE